MCTFWHHDTAANDVSYDEKFTSCDILSCVCALNEAAVWKKASFIDRRKKAAVSGNVISNIRISAPCGKAEASVDEDLVYPSSFFAQASIAFNIS